MLDGDLLESWKLWRQTEEGKNIDKTYREIETGEEYFDKVPTGEVDQTFKDCLGKLRDKYFKKYNTRKQRA